MRLFACSLWGTTIYGNLYNWYTATAGSGTQSGVTGGKDAPMSICPSAGKTTVDTTTNAPYAWKLPPSTGDGSYTNLFLTKAGLVTTTNGNNTTFVNTIQAEPYGFVLSGSYGSSPGNQGQHGAFWARSSYAPDGTTSRYLYFWNTTNTQSPGLFYLQNTHFKYIGRSVRCVPPRKMYF